MSALDFRAASAAATGRDEGTVEWPPSPLRLQRALVATGFPWHRLRAVRRGGGARAALRGVGVRLEFEEPVAGPIALGWGAHFGMGRFRALDT